MRSRDKELENSEIKTALPDVILLRKVDTFASLCDDYGVVWLLRAVYRD